MSRYKKELKEEYNIDNLSDKVLNKEGEDIKSKLIKPITLLIRYNYQFFRDLFKNVIIQIDFFN